MSSSKLFFGLFGSFVMSGSSVHYRSNIVCFWWRIQEKRREWKIICKATSVQIKGKDVQFFWNLFLLCLIRHKTSGVYEDQEGTSITQTFWADGSKKNWHQSFTNKQWTNHVCRTLLLNEVNISNTKKFTLVLKTKVCSPILKLINGIKSLL